jgi:hypothetical protein
VPGKSVGKIVKEEGSYTVQLDIGADAPVYCEVYPDGIDLARVLERAANATFKNVEEAQGKIEVRELEWLDAGAHGGVPYLQTQWVYLLAEKKELGGLKQFSLRKNGHGVYCSHVDLGYAKTFTTLAREFAASLEAPSEELAPHYAEVHAVSLGDRKVGVMTVTMARDADGDIQTREQTALLLPVDVGVLSAEDSYLTEWSNATGEMINALQMSVSDDEVEMDTALKAKGDAWVVEGEVQGKKVTYTLAAGSKPGTMLGQALDLRKLLAGEKPAGAEHRIGMWTDVDVSKLVDVKTRIKSRRDAGGWSAEGEIAGLMADLVLDANGSARSVEMRIGPQVMRATRVYVNGSF